MAEFAGFPTNEEKTEFSFEPNDNVSQQQQLLDVVKEEPPDESDEEFQWPLMEPNYNEYQEMDYSDQPEGSHFFQPVVTTKLTWHQARAESDQVRYKSTQDYFTYQESLSIFTYLLDEIRSRNPERLGRVAKRRVDLSDAQIWIRYKNSYAGRRSTTAYRGHYRAMSSKLHDFVGLSVMEKLDLYYALDIKVPRLVRDDLIDRYGVEFDHNGVIIGCPRMTHWDLVHPDSEQEDEVVKVKEKGKWMRFSEREDGLMWNFMLDHVIAGGSAKEIVSKSFWVECVKRQQEMGVNWKRVPDTYRGRYMKILAPNLHKMPFDIETKAALYQSLEITVDREFRYELIQATGVVIDENGKVTEYKNRPEHLVLQSRHYESVIGISSANRYSILKNPHYEHRDNNPYTAEEEKEIWTFIQMKMMNKKGKAVRIRQKYTGWSFWNDFKKEFKTKRTTKSLCAHFSENMIPNIMKMESDLISKMKLLFALNVPLDEENLNIIKQHTDSHVLNRKGAIRFVSGPGFSIGKLNNGMKGSYKKKLKKENVESSDDSDTSDDDLDGNDGEAAAEEVKNLESLWEKDIPSGSEKPEDLNKVENYEFRGVKLEEPEETIEPLIEEDASNLPGNMVENNELLNVKLEEPQEPIEETPNVADLPKNSVIFPYIHNRSGRYVKVTGESKMFQKKKIVEETVSSPTYPVNNKPLLRINPIHQNLTKNPSKNEAPKYVPIHKRAAYDLAMAQQRMAENNVEVVVQEPHPIKTNPPDQLIDAPRNVPYFARRRNRKKRQQGEPMDFDEFQSQITIKRTPGEVVKPPVICPTVPVTSTIKIPENIPAVSRYYYNTAAKWGTMSAKKKKRLNNIFNEVEHEIKEFLEKLKKVEIPEEERKQVLMRCEKLSHKLHDYGIDALTMKPEF